MSKINYTEFAIKKAIDGGYMENVLGEIKDFLPDCFTYTHVDYGECEMNYAELFLDPYFWKVLGKSEGWGQYHYPDGRLINAFEWQVQQHRLLDFIQQGKTPEDYFQSILCKK